jgi:NADH-quinone oxidoreductase subunit G
VIVSGTSGVDSATLEALGRIAARLRGQGADSRISCIFSGANPAGLALLTGAGGMGEAIEALKTLPADVVVLLSPDAEGVGGSPFFDLAGLLRGCRDTLLIDSLPSPLLALATAVLPAASWVEETGTFVNQAFRGQRYYPLHPPPGEVRSAEEWLTDLLGWAGEGRPPWAENTGLYTALAKQFPVLAPLASLVADPALGKVPRATRRASGRTSVSAQRSVHEPGVPADPGTPFAYSMEGSAGRTPPDLLPRYLAPGWHSPQALNRFQEEIGGPLVGGEPGVLLNPVTEEAR